MLIPVLRLPFLINAMGVLGYFDASEPLGSLPFSLSFGRDMISGQLPPD